MSRPIRVLLITSASVAVSALAVACGTQKITVPTSDPTHQGAVLFSQRCSGCHTLSYAGTRGSAANVRTREITNGPNFNVRCERPVTRVLYAIENGGFSGAIMPQNVVVGDQAREVAEFVAKFAGRQAPKIPGQATCDSQSIGTLPPPPSSTTAVASASTSATSTTSTTTTSTTTKSTSTAAKSNGGKSKNKKKKQ
jgi:mono/diheme cytochrome c family protein